jgi:hypothetical protein
MRLHDSPETASGCQSEARKICEDIAAQVFRQTDNLFGLIAPVARRQGFVSAGFDSPGFRAPRSFRHFAASSFLPVASTICTRRSTVSLSAA